MIEFKNTSDKEELVKSASMSIETDSPLIDKHYVTIHWDKPIPISVAARKLQVHLNAYIDTEINTNLVQEEFPCKIKTSKYPTMLRWIQRSLKKLKRVLKPS